ncbi:MAG: hypothetical protein Q7U94_06860 [Sideroxyarcus sp.]|nr:hypothetical protein [Sideroxyarcus sp.]
MMDRMEREMDLQAIYIKTAKGQQEVATRAFQLPSRVRSLLVMVDGKTGTEQLLANTAALGDSATFFTMLVEGGFIEAVASSVASAAAASAPAQNVKAPPKELVRTVSHLVIEILGPAGDPLSMRLEKSLSIEEFAKQVEQCRNVIESAAGKKRGDAFWNTVLEQLSAGTGTIKAGGA